MTNWEIVEVLLGIDTIGRQRFSTTAYDHSKLLSATIR
jgi:hypothetical protein